MARCEWTLPQNTFDILGGRVTGSVAVSFIPAASRSDEGEYKPEEGTIRAQATFAIRGERGFHRVPDQADNGFLELKLSPQVPPATS